MKKTNIRALSAVFLFALVPGISLGQTAADSTAFRAAQWNVREVMPGIESGGAGLELFGQPQYISFLIVDTSKYGLEIRQSPLLKSRTSRMAKRAKAAAAVNGGFFNVKTGRPVNLLKEDGKLRGNFAKYEDSRGYVAVAPDDKIVISTQETRIEETQLDSYDDVLALPRVLVKNGEPVILRDTQTHPRSAIGTDGRTLILMTADGRHPGDAMGLTLDETGWVMRMLGCTQALNLDGGGSSTLWNEMEGIVNHPSDNKKFDHKGERNVGSALLVVPRSKTWGEE